MERAAHNAPIAPAQLKFSKQRRGVDRSLVDPASSFRGQSGATRASMPIFCSAVCNGRPSSCRRPECLLAATEQRSGQAGSTSQEVAHPMARRDDVARARCSTTTRSRRSSFVSARWSSKRSSAVCARARRSKRRSGNLPITGLKIARRRSGAPRRRALRLPSRAREAAPEESDPQEKRRRRAPTRRRSGPLDRATGGCPRRAGARR